MSIAPRRYSATDPLTFLTNLPQRRLNAVLAYVNAIQAEDLESLAIFLKGQHPDASDEQIALMLGISRATLAKFERYVAAKPGLADYARVRRPPTKWRKHDGGWWPLDHPDR